MSISKKPAKKAKPRKKPKINKSDGKAKDERSSRGNRGKISFREVEYVEGILRNKTKTQAALDAGYSKNVANKTCHTWIGKTRDTSKKPHLFDYYQERLQKHLRLFDITRESVLHELKIIAFSSITNYVDLPSKPKELIDANLEPQAASLLAELGISAGGIRLKYGEDIPEEIRPAISEIHETKEGIRIKLHSKLDAIEKLAKYVKLYDEVDPGEASRVETINIVINGTKSPLFQKLMGDQAAQPKSS